MIFGPGLPGPQGVAGATGAQGPQGPAGTGGKVLQVVHATTSTAVLVSGTTAYTDTTLTATITPTASTSRILVLVSQSYSTFNTANGIAISAIGAIRILRGSTVIWTPGEDATGPFMVGANVGMTTATMDFLSDYGHQTIVAVDSPATTSPTTYKTQGRAYTTNHEIRFQPARAVLNPQSDLVLVEIAA